MDNKSARGYSVRIFIPSGEPEGIRVIEKSNWIGQGLAFPRSLFADARRRAELAGTGVYIIWGPGESGQLPKVYVGEGDQVLPRLEQHARSKDFWTQGIVFTSKDQNLNKAHVQHLESRLVSLALEANRCELENGNVPQPPSLSEADIADVAAFLEDLLLCLPLLGVDFFEKPKVSRAGKKKELFIKGKGIKGSGMDTPQGFIVLAGAQAVKEEVTSLRKYFSNIVALRHALIEKGVLEDAGDKFRLTQDYTFNSPSMAAGFLLGRSANGRIEWCDKNGRTLKSIQDEEAGG